MSIGAMLGAAKYLPKSLLLKALSKINPKFKNFFTDAAAYGYDVNQALDYLSNKFSNQNAENYSNQLEQGSQQGSLRPDERQILGDVQRSQMPGKLLRGVASLGVGGLLSKNPQEQVQEVSPQQSQQSAVQKIQQERQYDPLAGLSKFPELVQFIQREVHKGKDPMVVAQTAKKSPKLSPMVQMIEREIEEPFESLIGRLFSTFKGSQQAPQQQQRQDRSVEADLAVKIRQLMAK